ncbi:MAG TPA: dihydroxyacetone kinase phosphoryl donor subunit DhaM [Pseudonocardiaceae bacterium]|jgi:PTS hybrid protein|nr:dihydroxyacetone kinase phosphoryl donor subunit DhaM [Pseudonocardiaceae bacterium]
MTSGAAVGIVIVSHSAKLAEGVVELAGQMAPEVVIVAAGGLPDGSLGTDYDTVLAALNEADQGAGVVLLYDLGSARMTAELAIESLDDQDSALLATAPLVEGAVVAAVAAQGGADLTEVHRVAETAGAESESGPESGPQPQVAEPATPAVQAAFVLTNGVGLHARPAAQLARAIAGLDAEVTVRHGEQSADAGSVLGLLGLDARAGDTIAVTARGTQAGEAIERISTLVETNFGE